jgi:hypothetical protein
MYSPLHALVTLYIGVGMTLIFSLEVMGWACSLNEGDKTAC